MTIVTCLIQQSTLAVKPTFEEMVLKQLDKIEATVNGVDNNVNIVHRRLIALETWRDQQRDRIDGFYMNEWEKAQERIREIGSGLKNVETEMATIKGVVVSFMVIGSILSFFINMFLTMWLDRRKRRPTYLIATPEELDTLRDRNGFQMLTSSDQ